MTDDTDEYGNAAGSRPGTDSERRLAGLWADVLGVPVDRIQRTDNFFAIGGTSRAAARLVIALDRHVSINEFARTHSLSELADLLDQRLSVRSVTVTAAVPAIG
ncbi:phosphopantetheine-binding protein [Streptomyces sp. NPDC002054]|uniref:phosphopantetheine-binding protein n=1 Tax=Streptomyces sp. NPDC002054 TaxID=3154663 RepID=UPI00331BF3CE